MQRRAARLKSTTAPREPAMRPPPPPSWIVLAASSSRCTRSIADLVALGGRHVQRAAAHSGSSYWLIWYAFGLSG